jgi:hypothetical protein
LSEMKFKLTLLSLLFCIVLNGQNLTKRVLFLGNSYTSVNDLPQMTANIASSVGDNLIFDSYAPGGYTFQGHSTNNTSLTKIRLGNWDYVVLQEQSQLPSFPDAQVEESVFPYAYILDSIINKENACAETVFYMTWGRKNGDAQNCQGWPAVCTYEGMDNLLNLRYKTMADDNNAIVSPVGAVWRYIRENFPQIELYQTDESHPSVAGTYAAACCFYTILFRKDPTLITFNSTLSQTDAEKIRNGTKLIVFDNLENWNIGTYDPSASFTHSNLGNGQIAFSNNSQNSTSYLWNFGDGTTATEENPLHTYSITGSYTVTLLASKCGVQNQTTQVINIGALDILQNDITHARIYPNPTSGIVSVSIDANFIGFAYFLYDSKGTALLSGKITEENVKIRLSDLSDGIYWLKIGEKAKQIFKITEK